MIKLNSGDLWINKTNDFIWILIDHPSASWAYQNDIDWKICIITDGDGEHRTTNTVWITKDSESLVNMLEDDYEREAREEIKAKFLLMGLYDKLRHF